ncbi:ComEA family DNA-binding protein, partial [Janibacter anophelis]
GGPAPAGVAPGGAAPGGAAPGAGTPGAPGTPDALVNLNTADLATLETLPGVGPVLAQRIIDWRTEHGGFTSVEELGEVSGVGDKTYATLAPEVTV